MPTTTAILGATVLVTATAMAFAWLFYHSIAGASANTSRANHSIAGASVNERTETRYEKWKRRLTGFTLLRSLTDPIAWIELTSYLPVVGIYGVLPDELCESEAASLVNHMIAHLRRGNTRVTMIALATGRRFVCRQLFEKLTTSCFDVTVVLNDMHADGSETDAEGNFWPLDESVHFVQGDYNSAAIIERIADCIVSPSNVVLLLSWLPSLSLVQESSDNGQPWTELVAFDRHIAAYKKNGVSNVFVVIVSHFDVSACHGMRLHKHVRETCTAVIGEVVYMQRAVGRGHRPSYQRMLIVMF